MALKRLTINGYGQLELNQVAFRRDGRIIDQYKLNSGIDYVENGMLLLVDAVNKKIAMPSDTVANNVMVALNYSTEHMYDERQNALKDFKLVKDSFLPRLGLLAVGDRFTSNCIAYDDTEFAAVESPVAKTSEQVLLEAIAACATTPLYGCECSNGAIKLTATKPTTAAACLQVIADTTMPDGTKGVKFISLK